MRIKDYLKIIEGKVELSQIDVNSKLDKVIDLLGLQVSNQKAILSFLQELDKKLLGILTNIPDDVDVHNIKDDMNEKLDCIIEAIKELPKPVKVVKPDTKKTVSRNQFGTYTKFTLEEEKQIRALFNADLSDKQIAQQLGRTAKQVENKRLSMGLRRRVKK